MDQRTIQLGSRKLQKVRHSLTMTIPRVAVDTLGLQAGESMNIVLMPDDSLIITKE